MFELRKNINQIPEGTFTGKIHCIADGHEIYLWVMSSKFWGNGSKTLCIELFLPTYASKLLMVVILV